VGFGINSSRKVAFVLVGIFGGIMAGIFAAMLGTAGP